VPNVAVKFDTELQAITVLASIKLNCISPKKKAQWFYVKWLQKP